MFKYILPLLVCFSALAQDRNSMIIRRGGGGSGGAVTGSYSATFPLTLSGTNFGVNTNAFIMSGGPGARGTNVALEGTTTLGIAVVPTGGQVDLQGSSTLTLNTADASSLAGFGAGKTLESIPGVSSTEAGYLANVTSDIQTQLNLHGMSVTNNPNSWYVWTSTNGGATNAYFAENRQTATKLYSNDFSGMLQQVANRVGEGGHIVIAGHPAYANRYVFSNTVVFTNAFVMEAAGNPSTVFIAASGLAVPMIQLGEQTTVGIGGIGRMKYIRFEADAGATNCVGVKIEKCAEPVFEYCEWTGFKMAGLQFSSTNYIHWSKVDNCWFVQKWTSSKGILIDGTPIDIPSQNHLIIENSIFGMFGGGQAIVVSNTFQNITVQNNHLRYSSGTAANFIEAYAGVNYRISGNDFQQVPSTIFPVVFNDAGAATNYAIHLADNKIRNYGAAAPDNLAYIGANITNILELGNSGFADTALSLGGGNGAIRNGVNASYLTEGTVPTARLGSGTADNTTYLRGDNTWATPSGGSGGTNFPPVINQLGSTNLGVTGGVRLVQTITTNASFAFNVQGTAPNGFTFLLGVSNYSSSPINLTNHAGGTASTAFSPSVASNVTTVAIPATSIKWIEFLAETNFNLGTVRWNIIREEGKKPELAVAGNITIHTNAAGSIVTVSNTPPTAAAGGNSAAIQFNEGGSLAGTNRFIYDRTNEAVRLHGTLPIIQMADVILLATNELDATGLNAMTSLGEVRLKYRGSNILVAKYTGETLISGNSTYTIQIPAITASNILVSCDTNRYELVGLTNVVLTNIVEKATGTGGSVMLTIRNTLGSSIPIVYPAFGAQHGYYFHTNGFNDILTASVAPPGTNTVVSLDIQGTNIYPTVTYWRHP